MMKKILVMVMMIVGSMAGYGQHWVSLGIPKTLNYDGRVLYTDTVLDKLLVGGDFTTVNGHRAYGIANWDGTTWDTLNGGFDLNSISAKGKLCIIRN